MALDAGIHRIVRVGIKPHQVPFPVGEADHDLGHGLLAGKGQRQIKSRRELRFQILQHGFHAILETLIGRRIHRQMHRTDRLTPVSSIRLAQLPNRLDQFSTAKV